MGKIEEGCMAIVINSANHENIGKVVTVGKFVGSLPTFKGNDIWEVDKLMKTRYVIKNTQTVIDNDYKYMQRECNLQRIDDLPDPVVKETKERELEDA